MNKYKKLFSDTMIFGIGNFATKFIYFFLMPIYTLSLTPEEYGLADLLNNLLYLLMPILTLSISDAVFRFVLDKNSDVSKVFANGITVLLFSYIVAFLVTFVVSLFMPFGYVWWFLVLFIVESLKLFLAQYVRGLGYVKIFAVNGILCAAFLLLSTCIFLFQCKLGVNGYLYSFIVADIVSIIYLRLKMNRFLWHICWSLNCSMLNPMLRYSIPLTPNMLSWWITNVSARYVIVAFCGLDMAGLFAGASKIPTLINVATTVFQQSWQYASVKEYEGANESLFYTKVFQLYSLFIILFGSVVLAFLPFISKFVLMGEFYEAWIYTPLLVFSAILGGYSIFFGTFYAVVKVNKNAMYSTMIGAFVNLVCMFIFIPLWGIVGALVANVLSYLVIVIVRVYDSRKYVHVTIDWNKQMISVGLLLFQAIVLTTVFRCNQHVSIGITILLLIIHFRDIRNLKFLINSKDKE